MNILRLGMLMAATEHNSADGDDNLFFTQIKHLLHRSSVASKAVSIKAAFQEYGVKSIWHMTHYSNVQGILQNGLLSNIDANPNIDISEQSVQRHRYRSEPCYGQPINSYVPFYINIKNAMLYSRRKIQSEVCILEVDITSIAEDDFIFTDGNAAARDTSFFCDIKDINQLPWNVLGGLYWSGYTDGKRKRSAEVLIKSPLDPRFIKNIYCKNIWTKEYLQTQGIIAQLNNRLYFNDC